MLASYGKYAVPAEMKIFDSDLAIANAWKRLELGKYTKYDIQLLKHETTEAWYMKKYGPSYTKAHNVAEKRFPAPDLDDVKLDNNMSFKK